MNPLLNRVPLVGPCPFGSLVVPDQFLLEFPFEWIVLLELGHRGNEDQTLQVEEECPEWHVPPEACPIIEGVLVRSVRLEFGYLVHTA